MALEGVISATMSSTGFVTFLDLSSTTCASSAPLSVKSSVLLAKVAPEPREIRWQNAHVSRKTQLRREYMVNTLLFVGVIFWSFPLAAIQAFAKAETLVRGRTSICAFLVTILCSFLLFYGRTGTYSRAGVDRNFQCWRKYYAPLFPFTAFVMLWFLTVFETEVESFRQRLSSGGRPPGSYLDLTCTLRIHSSQNRAP